MTNEMRWAFIVMWSLILLVSILSIWREKGAFCLSLSALACVAATESSEFYAFGAFLPLLLAFCGINRLLRRVLRRPTGSEIKVRRRIKITAVAISISLAAVALHIYGYSGILSPLAFVFAVAVLDLLAFPSTTIFTRQPRSTV